MRLSADDLRGIDKVFIGYQVSYHAAMVAKYAIERTFKLVIDIASEFRYRDPVLNERTLCVGVSQSGETLDTSEAMREAARLGAKVLVVSNVVDSSMAGGRRGALHAGGRLRDRGGVDKVPPGADRCARGAGSVPGPIVRRSRRQRSTRPCMPWRGLPRLVAGTLERVGDVDDVAKPSPNRYP